MNVWLRQRKDGKRQEERVEDAAGFAAHGAGTGKGEGELTGSEGRFYRFYDCEV